MPITKEQLFAMPLPVKPVECPGYPTVFVRMPSVATRAKISQANAGEDDLAKLQVLALMHCLCDEDGRLLFAAGDGDGIAGLSTVLVETVFHAIVDMIRFRPQDVDAAEKKS